MSKVAIQGAATGTGVFTLASPATNTDRTLTLPDEAGTVLVNGTTSNVGIGTSSPSSFYSLANNLVVGTGSGGNGLTIYSGSADSGYIGFNDTASASMQGFIQYNHSGDYMAFAPNGGEKVRIDSSGNLLVGTTGNIVNNNARVAIVGTEGLRAQATAGGGTACVGAFGTSTGGTYYYVGYDLTAGSIKYQVLFNGNVQNTNNSYGAISDVKLKENIVDATPKLDKLAQVRVVNYNLKTDPDQKQLIGVVAQELEQIFPGMVEESPDYDMEGNDLGTTTKAVKYSVFVPMLIKAMQEQQAIIESLTARVVALEGQP
jgi:hypothetical protein